MLFVVATPIGNLADITYRAIDTLRSSAYILCEDARKSEILLRHYQITKPVKSFHKFNETAKENQVLADLKNGLNIALICDAGTPGISDPGAKLIATCKTEGVPVCALPGACAAIVALTSSGLDSMRFQFLGFLPKKEKEIKNFLLDALQYPGTSIAYESPHRICETLTLLEQIAPTRRLCIARELTKIYEETLEGAPNELLSHFQKHPPKGEMVLLFEGQEVEPDFSHLSPKEHVEQIQTEYGLSKNEAIKMVALLRNVPKKTIYSSQIEK